MIVLFCMNDGHKKEKDRQEAKAYGKPTPWLTLDYIYNQSCVGTNHLVGWVIGKKLKKQTKKKPAKYGWEPTLTW